MFNGLTSVTYDARGNLTTHGGSTYSYSADNQLLTGANGTGMTGDALGRLKPLHPRTNDQRRPLQL